MDETYLSNIWQRKKGRLAVGNRSDEKGKLRFPGEAWSNGITKTAFKRRVPLSYEVFLTTVKIKIHSFMT